MKVLVISDTHGRIENVKRVLDQTIPFGIKTVLHCGDYLSDAKLIQKFYPEVEVYGVSGNCDGGYLVESSKVISIEGVPIYMTHGHRYGVKWGDYEELIIDAEAYGAKVALCGHSHCAYLLRRQELWLVNPGSISQPRDGQNPSYGIIEIQNSMIKEVRVLQLLDNGGVTTHPIMYTYKLQS